MGKVTSTTPELPAKSYMLSTTGFKSAINRLESGEGHSFLHNQKERKKERRK
jgi:hypothetical protein